MSTQDPVWHPEVLDPETRQTLLHLHQGSLLRGFYLGGGTGLALWLGHRKSADLDFFSSTGFSEEVLVQRLRGQFDHLTVLSRDMETLHLHVNGTKVSLLGYRYPQLYPFAWFEGVPIADPRDIACMKLSALAGRGTRRDFVDLYTVAETRGLSHLLDLFSKKFERVDYSHLHLLKSLTYFEDAEKDPLPVLLVDVQWETVKQFFTTQVPRLL